MNAKITRENHPIQTPVKKTTNKQPKPTGYAAELPKLQEGTLDKARRAAPGYGIYHLQNEWLSYWANNGRKKLDNPDGAFIRFCKNRYENQSLF